MDLSHAADTDGFAEIDVACNCGGAGVEPSTYVLNQVEGIRGRDCRVYGAEQGGRGCTSRLIGVGVLWRERF